MSLAAYRCAAQFWLRVTVLALTVAALLPGLPSEPGLVILVAAAVSLIVTRLFDGRQAPVARAALRCVSRHDESTAPTPFWRSVAPSRHPRRSRAPGSS